MTSANLEIHNEKSTSGSPSVLQELDIGRIPERTIFLGAIALAVYSVLRNLIHAAGKPLWFDELLTEAVSRQPNLSAVWNALKNGVDGNPPFFYLIERAASKVTSNEMIAFRLPSIFAFSCTLICVYLFVQKRSGARNAFLCFLLLFVTPLNTIYAAEARPYSLLVACLAIALVSYQRLPSVPWTLGFFVSLSLAESLHYYAGLACFPFFTAELVYLYHTGRFRTWTWLSMFASLAPAVLSIPFLLRIRSVYGPHFWARPEFMLIPRSYGIYFRLDAMWGAAIATVAFLIVLGSWAQTRKLYEAREENDAPPPSEHAIVLGILALPIFGVVIAKIAHGGATDRYYLPAILGMVAAFGYALKRLMPAQFNLVAALILAAVASQEVGFFRLVLSSHGAGENRAAFLPPILSAAHRSDLPVVISDAGQYVEFSHDAPQTLNARMVALVDPSNALVYAGTDTVDHVVSALRYCEPLHVYDFKPFAAAHPVFLLYSDGSPFDWWPSRLAHDGAVVELVAKQGPGILYWVALKPDLAVNR
jgi:Dolichyl-phosphate-mannose-protein mannosyltransferase